MICPAGLAVSFLLTRYVFPGAQGSGIPQVIAAQHMTDRAMIARVLSLRIAVGKIGLTLLGLCCGASIGREGPTVQVGASIMHALGRLLRLPRLELERALVLAGGAAGVAAAFNTPLAGVVFAIEELSHSFEARTSGTVLTAVIIAGITTLAVMGNYTYFGHTSAELDFGRGWIAVVLCSVAGGLSGGLFSAALVRFARGLPGRVGGWLMRNPVVFAALCGLALAAIGIASGGQTYGTGYEQARGMVEGTTTLPASYVVLKFAATVISYISGIPGGLFAPSLSVGAGLGRVAGAPDAVGAGRRGRAAGHGGVFLRRGAGADHLRDHRDGDDRQPARDNSAAGDVVSGIRHIAAGVPAADLWRAGTTLPRSAGASAGASVPLVARRSPMAVMIAAARQRRPADGVYFGLVGAGAGLGSTVGMAKVTGAPVCGAAVTAPPAEVTDGAAGAAGAGVVAGWSDPSKAAAIGADTAGTSAAGGKGGTAGAAFADAGEAAVVDGGGAAAEEAGAKEDGAEEAEAEEGVAEGAGMEAAGTAGLPLSAFFTAGCSGSGTV